MSEAYRSDLLQGHHIVVTGGGTGLGRVMAIRFASLGASVSICGRREDKLSQTVAEIQGAGGQAVGVTCDVREADSVESFLTAAESQQGAITGLVNNAAGNFLASSEGLSIRAFDTVVRTNLYGSFNFTIACGRRWIESDTGGAVVSIAATYSDTGSAFVLPSAVSKAGIVTMMRSLAVEWGAHRIRLNAISPGPVPTKGAWDRLMPDAKAEEKLKARVPLGRFGKPEEVAGMAVYLLSELGEFVTGQDFTLDGAEKLASGGLFNELTRLPKQEQQALFEGLRKRARK